MAMNTQKILEDHGHETAFFSMQYPENISSEYDSFFPEEVSFSGGGISGKVSAVKRLLGRGEVASKFTALLDDFCPDVVHLHNVHSYLSPIVAEIAKSRGVRVVWTLHDYKLICPTYSFLREGKVCELCLTQPTAVVTTKCMKRSLSASLIAYMEAIVWNRERLIRNTDVFICPSHFMAEKMKQGGFPPSKIEVLPNFVSMEQTGDTPVHREKAYCYIGRLSEEKGVRMLLEVASRLPYKLYVAGTGPLISDLERYFQQENIVYLGQLSKNQVYDLLQKVSFLVVPSICYENNPLSVIESLCMGTPVLGANIGGIPELIQEGRNGFLFEAKNKHSLTETIICFFDSADQKKLVNLEEISRKALINFSSSRYYDDLISIYSFSQ